MGGRLVTWVGMLTILVLVLTALGIVEVVVYLPIFDPEPIEPLPIHDVQPLSERESTTAAVIALRQASPDRLTRVSSHELESR
jgi:hypothetical protein